VHCLNSTSCLISSIFFDSQLILMLLYNSLSFVVNSFSYRDRHGSGERSRRRCSSWTVLHARHISALSSGFPISQGNAQALDRRGGKTKHHMILHFLSNTSAKNYRNRIVYVKIIASRRWHVFETRCMCLRVMLVYCG